MKKRFLIETTIITFSEDVINNTFDFLNVDVDECMSTVSKIINLYKCPSCKKEVIQKGHNYCPFCGEKIDSKKLAI